MTTDANPFDDFRDLINAAPLADEKAREAISERIESYIPALSPFGHLAPVMKWLSGWQGRADISITRPLVAVFAGSHGAAGPVMDQDPAIGAKARVEGLTSGPAAVRGMASAFGAAFKVYEMGIEYPCADMTKEASLSERDCAAAMAFGMEIVAEGADIIVLGNAGYGSAMAAAAIAYGLFGGSAAYWADSNDKRAKDRMEAIIAATTLHRAQLSDPLQVLRCFGGRDIAGMIGAILAARHQSIPIILDGYVVCAAAAVLHKISPESISHCYAGHLSSEPAHGALLDRLNLKPMLDLGIGVGDGTGSVLALGSLIAAAKGLQSTQ